MRFEIRSSDADVSYLPKLALSRGKAPLFLDENLLFLKEPLEKREFTVLSACPGKSDADLIAEDLPGRIFVTNNPKDSIYSAALLGYSIIDTTQISKDTQALTEMIARARVDYSLR